MKYGFCRDPSFRSKSSTAKRENVTNAGIGFAPKSQDLLTEAEEERVHTHVVHTEEPVSYEVAANHNGLNSTDSKRHN